MCFVVPKGATPVHASRMHRNRALQLACPLAWNTCLSTVILKTHCLKILMTSVFSQTVKSMMANYLRSVASTTPKEPADHARFSHTGDVDWEKTADTAIYPTQSLSRTRVVKALGRSAIDHNRRWLAARVQTLGAARSLYKQLG